MAGQPKLADGKVSTAMDALLKATELQRPPPCTRWSPPSSRSTNAPRGSLDAKDKLAAWLPSGPTAVADYPTVLLSGDWLSQRTDRRRK